MSQEIVYNINGEVCQKSHTNVAKHLILGKDEKYFIKYFDFGPQRTTPVNPYGFDFSIKQLLPDSPIGTSFASYREVSKECFDLYIKFLQTKNTALHTQIINLRGYQC